MISAELRKQIKKLQLKAGHEVTDMLTGDYISAFKGRGMEFDEVRGYNPGDDVRTIDWNVSARMGEPYIKVFKEEREMTLMLLLDVSRSQYFGSTQRQKIEIAAELAAVLAFLAINNNDRVGVVLFSDHVEQFIPPQKGRAHIWNIIRAVLSHEPQGTSTNLSEALETLLKFKSKRSLCFLISDFLADGYEQKMKQVASRHDLVCVQIDDPREREWVDSGLIALKDSESGRSFWFDSGDRQLRQQLVQQSARKRENLEALAKQGAFDFMSLGTDESIVDGLSEVFRRRGKRRRKS